MKLRDKIEPFLPGEMQGVIWNFHNQRPHSFKPLIDVKFSGDDFGDVSWDMLYDLDGEAEYNRAIQKARNDNERYRMLMAERAKARLKW